MNKEKSSVYLAISKSNRMNFDQEIAVIQHCLNRYHAQLLVFVDQYNFKPDQEKEMMETAFNAIDNSNWMIAEVSKKAIGVGVEVGYAKAKNKPIIYLKKKGSPYSTTVGGSSDYKIEYLNEKDLEIELNVILKLITGDTLKNQPI